MTLMGFDIGGAETHVLELSKMLSHMGIEVHVVSNGGVYVKELEDCGIRHYHVPLHNKQFINLFSSYKTLKKIITENNIRLVHAHARIPAFICGLLKKRLDFFLVTTAHGNFSLAFPFRKLSNWGDKTLAVSEDIKNYLCKNYKRVKPDNVFLTVNGIDTVRFSPDIESESIFAELNLKRDTYKVLCVSRMDKPTGIVPLTLAEIAKDLAKVKPVEIIIVGDGADMPEIKSLADDANKAMGKFVHITGSRTDVNKFLPLCDVFVNVSRAAMEAMSAAKPVVLAGGQGYLGVFDESNVEIAVETNFTCRGLPDTTPDKMLSDIVKVLDMSKEERKKLGKYGREYIKRFYSLERMAQDAVKIYETVLTDPKPKNIVISGYYGFNNSGDDMLLRSITQNLRNERANLNITVLSNKPQKTRADFNVGAVYRFNILSVLYKLFRADLLLTGGGNLIQDETSTKSLLYYLFLMRAARFFGAKNMLYGKGIGPVSRCHNIKRVKKALNRVEMITLREPGSLEVMKEVGIYKPKTHVTADAVFALPPADDKPEILSELGITRPFAAISIRLWMNNPPDFAEQIANFADFLVEKYNYQIVYVLMFAEQDRPVSERAVALMKHKAIIAEFPSDNTDPDRERRLLGLSDFALCMRLHGLIYAMEKGVPSIGIVYGTKIKQFMEAMNQAHHLPVEEIQAETLIRFAEEIHENKQAVSRAILDSVAQMREKAALNAKLCVELIDGI